MGFVIHENEDHRICDDDDDWGLSIDLSLCICLHDAITHDVMNALRNQQNAREILIFDPETSK